MMRFGYYALRDGDWEEYKRIFKVKVRIRDEAGSLSIVLGIMLKSTDFLRRIIAPARGQGGVALSYTCPHCNSFPPEDCIWWVPAGKKAEKNLNGENPRRERASSQEREMPIYGLKFGKNCIIWQKGAFWWNWNMSKHTARRKKNKGDVAL